MDSDSQDGQHWMENLDAKLIASFEAMGEDFSWEDISWSHRGEKCWIWCLASASLGGRIPFFVHGWVTSVMLGFRGVVTIQDRTEPARTARDPAKDKDRPPTKCEWDYDIF